MAERDVSIVAPRLDEKPWGGRNLERYGLDLPAEGVIGEALVTADDAVITAGIGEGQTLGDLVHADPQGRIGDRGLSAVGGRGRFPLLVKLIDAAENLSIQVHPDDDRAATVDKLGKTEAWYVLSAGDEGALYAGLEDDVTQHQFIEHAHLLNGRSAHDLRRLKAHEGMVIILPAGTVHALGADVMVYEIQQPSDITYRMDDWGRVDAEGNPREMHLDQGEEAMRADLRPREIPGVRLDVSGKRTLLTACRYFALEKLALLEMDAVTVGKADSPDVVTVLRGQVRVGDHDLVAGESAVIWRTDEPVEMTAMATTLVLRSWVPDLEADIVAPAIAAGASPSDVAALGGMTGDLEALLG